MALSFSTGMTSISNADAVTNWSAYRISGSGGAPSASTSTDVFKEGTASNSTKITGASWDGGLIFDYYTANGNTALNLTTAGNEVIAIWALCTTPGIIQTFANNGIYILAQSSTETTTTAPTVYAKWTVSGSDVYPGGWVLFMIDTRKTATTTAGSPNLAAVRRIAVGLNIVAAPGTIRADNLYVDACWYGRPRYTLNGDGSTTANWASFLSHSNTAKNGLINDLGGVYQIACGIRFGTTGQTATTTFSDATGQQVVWRRPTYYRSGVLDALTYADYYNIDALGASGNKTSVTFGSVVGSGDNRQGVLGGGILTPDSTNLTYNVDFQTGIANLTACKLYGLSLSGAKGGILLNNDSGATLTDAISCTFVNCGEIDPGTTGGGATILNSTLINPLGGTSANRGIIMNSTTNVKKLSCITSGTPSTQHLTRIPTSGTASITFNAIVFYGSYTSSTLWHGEASAASATITINGSNGANPDAAEFEKTGVPAATVTVSNPTALTVSIVDSNGNAITSTSEITIVKVSDETVLYHDESVTTGSTTYNYNSGAGTDTYINVANVAGYQNKTAYHTLAASNETFVIQLDDDRIYSNPV